VCTLAHVFEAEGIATVVLAAIGEHAERVHPPRALYCEFPLGRPLGRPGDAELQRRVLEAAFALLERSDGPVLETFPESIHAEGEGALACPLPPRVDPSLHPAVDEARALRSAFERTLSAAEGRTAVGRAVDAERVPDVLAALARITDGTSWKEAGLPGNPIAASLDVRAYYEEASLASRLPAAWQSERWFFEQTEGGKLLLAARAALREQGAPQPLWFFMAPAAR
jgi:hypothetical protein